MADNIQVVGWLGGWLRVSRGVPTLGQGVPVTVDQSFAV